MIEIKQCDIQDINTLYTLIRKASSFDSDILLPRYLLKTFKNMVAKKRMKLTNDFSGGVRNYDYIGTLSLRKRKINIFTKRFVDINMRIGGF